MAPGVKSLNHSALRSAGDLQLIAPEKTVLQFKHISSLRSGAALRAKRHIRLQGSGSMVFQDLHTIRAGGAVYSFDFGIYASVANLLFQNCSAGRVGGAMYGGHCVILESIEASHVVRFEDCSSRFRGGAVASRGQINFTGKGTTLFEQCRSDTRGGAVGTYEDVVVQLQAEGSVGFSQCHTKGWAGTDIYGGGAIAATSNINFSSGHVLFSHCSSDSHLGNAVMTKQGHLNIGEEAWITFAGMERLQGSRMFARVATIPPDGSVLPSYVFTTHVLLASQTSHTLATCEAGSRFWIEEDGSPVPGKCIMCLPGTASLAAATLRIEGKVVAPEEGMELVLVHRSSPNSLKSLGVPFIKDDACATDDGCLGISQGRQVDEYNWVLPLVLGYRNKIAVSFHDGHLQATGAGGHLVGNLAVPWKAYFAGTALTIVEQGQSVAWSEVNESQMFQVDNDGVVSLRQSPVLTVGLERDVNYIFDPPDPYGACATCYELAEQLQDKIRCLGATRVQSLPGYMTLHQAGKRTLEVHKCPNWAACPGSKLSITAEGRMSSHSWLCAEGYQPTAGCVRCATGYGRPQLDPFVCEDCGNASLVQQVGVALLSSGFFYGMALSAARPRSHTQQIVKVFLSFVTISCRSLSAVSHTRQYQQLREDVYTSAQWLYQLLFSTDLALRAEPGAGIGSFDCWGLTDGPIPLLYSLGLSWAIPTILFLLSCFWFGIGAWRLCLVVWGNVFIPPLVGAVAKLAPCYTTQEEAHRVLMYEAAFGTPCASTIAEAMALPRFWVAVGATALLVLIGPVLWLSLAAPASATKYGNEIDQNISFLVEGYEPKYRWWEVMVLARKSAIYMVAAWFPMSWAPAAHLVYLLLIMVLAELIHEGTRPYVSSRLDRLEGLALGISCACLVLVSSLLSEWPFRPYAIYVGTCILLVLLTGGTYLYFLRIYMRAVLAKDHAPEQDGEDDSEEKESEDADTPAC